MSKDYQRALEDLDKAYVLELNNVFTLIRRANVKNMLKDYQQALKDLDKVDVLKPNNAFILKHVEMSKGCWMTITKPCRTLTRLMFLNQIMH
jgi:lipopolysaccharide biosynthesis regulator YciM